MGISKREAIQYAEDYFAQYPDLERWIIETRKRGVEEQVVKSLFGRRRRFPLITGRYHQREVMRAIGNMPVSSASNDMTLLAYANSVRWLREEGIPVQPGAHIHDSLNVSVPLTLWKPAVEIIVETMSDVPFETEVEFPAEIEVGERWGEMFVVHKGGAWVTPDLGDAPDWLRRNFASELESEAAEQLEEDLEGVEQQLILGLV